MINFILMIIMIIVIIVLVILFMFFTNKKENKEKFQNRSNLIKFIRCIFFTNKQYNTDKIHIPKNSLYIQQDIRINTINDVDNFINKIIDKVFVRLNAGNNTGVPVKIPAPILTLIGRKLEYHESIFDGENFKSPFIYPFKYGSETITPNNKGELAILSFFKSFFNSGLGDMPKNKENLTGSLASSFKFKRNVRIIIYFPYLTNNYKYISNFTDIINSSRFFHTLITSNNFLNFKKTSLVTYDSLKQKFKRLDDNTIYLLLSILTREDSKIFTFFEDLQHLCLEGGCVSDYGEDLNSLTTTFGDDMNKNNEEAIKKSPYLPSKCLAQTKGYIRNIRDVSDNVDLPDFLKKHAMKEISESLTKYIEISDKISKGDKSVANDDRSKEIADYTSPVDLIISIMNKYILKGYSTNLNDGDRDGIKLNHYSKEYSKNIIKELSLLNKIYPGIPEMVLSLYLIDETVKSDKIIYHPWGRKLLSARNVLKLGELIPAQKSLFSFNNRYIMTITNNGIIYTYDKQSGRILYFLNRSPIQNTQGVSITTTSIIVEYIASDKNRKSQTLKLPNNIKSLIGDCDDCKEEPFNLIISDTDGSIIIYANSFFNANSSEFNNYLNSERNNAERLNMNINDQDFKNKIGSNIEIGIEEDYVFCADKDDECKK